MVAVPSRQERSPERLPVRLSPAPRGEWRWINGRTLVLEVEEGLAGPSTLAAVLGAQALSGAVLEPFSLTLWNRALHRPLVSPPGAAPAGRLFRPESRNAVRSAESAAQ